MEDPLGDSMDMASPYPGHADDFEIDIDIMEDQPSNADNDFDVKDASPEALAAAAEPPNDADMHDVAEPSATDAFHHNTDSHNQNASTFYSSHVTYESEMVDEDYEEDIDAPIPDSEAIAVEAGQTVEQNLEEQPVPSRDENQHVEPVVNEHDQHVNAEEHGPNAADEGINQHDTERFPEGVHENEHDQYDEATSHRDDTNSTVHIESKQAPALSNTEAHPPDQPDGGEPDEVGPVHDLGEEHVQNPETGHEREEEDQLPETKQHERYLHPVKVLYQDSEISLFPPREGDTSETFFLEDEGLAYENLGSLLAACRQVLGEHVSDDEALVVDIESLGLQLSEDNLHVSKMTLSQIVDIYLHLCHNDGVDEPEPLYLTLSTRSTLLAEISNLAMAADEGKGISLIHSWDEYGNQEEEEPGDDTEAADNGDFQEKQTGVSDDLPVNAISEPPAEPEEGQDDVAPANQGPGDHIASADQALDKDLSKSDSSHVEHANDADTNQEVIENEVLSREQDHGSASGAQVNEDDGHAENFYHASQEEAQDNQQLEQVLSSTDLPAEGPYDSEEQTESTATLAHASVTQSDERQEGEVVDLSSGQDHITSDHYDYENEHDSGEVGGNEDEEDDEAEEDNLEEQNIEEAEEDYDGGEEEEGEVEYEEYEEVEEEVEAEAEAEAEPEAEPEPEPRAEAEAEAEAATAANPDEGFTLHQGISSDSGDRQASATSSHHEVPSGSGQGHSTDHQSWNAIPGPYDDTEGGKQIPIDHVDQSGQTTRQTPELPDDLLGVDEDLFASPDKGAKSAGSTLAGQADKDLGNPEEEQANAHDNTHSLHQSGDDFEELGFEDDDYFELDDTGHPGDEDRELGAEKLHVHGSGPGKRSREAEDEEDFAQIPTPDAKRSRPS
ncbi:hypothetical protein VTN77DRAFT_8057 [Rasamsonia byssochlamydoides]|uniref:uncharacterized protein n=1 Tax=Rasamsonia byssochlamydoides TaxID=89139 RepID=UPI0037434BAA